MTRRRWIADRWNENSATLLDEQAAHLARVLARTNWPGVRYRHWKCGSARGHRNGDCRMLSSFRCTRKWKRRRSLPLIVALSIVRFERMEWAIEKLTELGVGRIIPLIAQRSEKHLVLASAKRCRALEENIA